MRIQYSRALRGERVKERHTSVEEGHDGIGHHGAREDLYDSLGEGLLLALLPLAVASSLARCCVLLRHPLYTLGPMCQCMSCMFRSRKGVLCQSPLFLFDGKRKEVDDDDGGGDEG